MLLIELTSDDAMLVENYGLHWLEMGVRTPDVRGDWRAEARRFLREARESSGLGAFLARVEGEPVGTACCHIVPRTFPAFRVTDASKLGYVWRVYVQPAHRGKGVGGKLVSACLSHLIQRGCGRALLHAGERSAVLYRRMGFAPTDEYSTAL